MTAGFEVVNDRGVQIVDEHYVCLALRAQGAATANIGTGIGTIQYVDIGYAGADVPLLVIYKPQRNGRGDEGACIMGARRNGDGSWTFRVACFGSPSVVGGIDYSFSWYVFDRPPVVSSGAGVEVYGPDGGIVFSSIWRPMKIVGSGQIMGLPSGKWGFAFNSNIEIVNDSVEITSSSGGTNFVDVWRGTIGGCFCAPDGIYSNAYQTGGQGRNEYIYGDLDGGGGGSSFVVNLAGL
ncbi:hypothetical protein [Sphingomonas nostoxanthinifaciens]|uniref:hypothetical protein n=1 Tax=Sphingomonas nostoxanthinifaciens TaxID=2872652 RepID=UPI001CC1DFF8|nr:hypothetical protein [Sphingomonas nostoxanthinifaciens]UAK25870.1 hypothetical protein K8P63_07045 [Sphingomonas nostoxanthinifaciens]